MLINGKESGRKILKMCHLPLLPRYRNGFKMINLLINYIKIYDVFQYILII